MSQETRKRFGPIKEAAEAAILKIKTLCSLNDKGSRDPPLTPLKEHCNVVLQPFLMGCDTKCRDITLLCISAIQRLITHQVLNEPAASNIVSLLWQLMEAQLEEVRLLQVKFQVNLTIYHRFCL